MLDPAPADPGLQSERTLLAWQRTMLSIAGGCLVGIRVSAPYLGDAAVGLGLLGLALASAGFLAAAYRYRRGDDLRPGLHSAISGGLTLWLLAAAMLVVAAGAILYVLARAVAANAQRLPWG